VTGIMTDSTNPQAVISAAKVGTIWRNMKQVAGAGYVDGANSAWPSSAFGALAGMKLKPVTITVTGINAMVGDVETGDLDPETGAVWAGEQARAGGMPCLYVERSNKAPTVANCVAEGLVLGKTLFLWVATLDGSFVDTDGTDLRGKPGVVAVQYAQATSPVHVSGQPPDLDVSVVTALGDQWLGLASWQSQALAAAQAIHASMGDLVRELEAHQ
jgi:hypothetical protein